MEKLLDVKELKISFDTYAGEVQAVRGVSFDLCRGETLGIVGESGCGKSVTAQGIMQLLLKPPARYKGGSVMFNGEDLIKKPEKEIRKIRGNEIGMIFQDPMTSLNPTMKIGYQIAEGLMLHHRMKKADAIKKAVEMLKMVSIAHPEKRIQQYPHEFSGGMRQRAMIALALACEPRLLIADEPTTALDVTIQAQILELLKEIQQKTNTSIILITHDLGIVAKMCDRVIVMYAGKILESGTVYDIFDKLKHPYTKGLLKSVPSMEMSRNEALTPIPGSPPDLFDPPDGCPFYARCKNAMKVCRGCYPELIEFGKGHKAACWLYHPLASEFTA